MTAPDGGPVLALIQVRLIGSFAVIRDGSPVPGLDLGSRKARMLLMLLMLLAVERARAASAERIIEVLCGNALPAGPVENVATLVSRPRRACRRQAQGGIGRARCA
jgi:DNA-binding SARP family transcriptional activator